MMDKTLTDAAIRALDALMVAELGTTDPARYGRIIKLCKQAHELVQMTATRVKQVAEADYEGNVHICANNEVGMMPLVEPAYDGLPAVAGRLRVAGGGGDAPDLIREMVAAFQMIQKNKEPTTEDELQAALDLRERLEGAGRPTTAIDKRIDALMAKLEQEENDAAGPDVVRPQLLRGSQAGADGEGLPADHGGAVGEGEDGAGDADEGGDEEGVGAGGHAPRAA